MKLETDPVRSADEGRQALSYQFTSMTQYEYKYVRVL